MTGPTTQLTTLRPDLQGSVEAFDLAADRLGFIGHLVLPIFDVPKSGGTYGKIPLKELLKSADDVRAPGSGYARGNFKFTKANYFTEEHGFEMPIDDNERENYADYFDLEVVSAELAVDQLRRNKERRVAAKVFDPTVWTGDDLTTGVTNEWDDFDNAEPVTDVREAQKKVWKNSGVWPNSLVMSYIVFRNVIRCAQVIEEIRSGGTGSPTKPDDITPAMLKAVFQVKNLFVGGASKNDANESQDAEIEQIWSPEYVSVCGIFPSRDIRRPTLGRTWHWAQDGSSPEGTMETYRDEKVRSDIIRIRNQVNEDIMFPEFAHLLSNITEPDA